jgi:nucleoside-diphosphate-sugar epimerase
VNKKVSILGCGWLGKALAETLISDDYNIKGSTTKTENLNGLNQLGISPYIVNIENNSINAQFLDTDILVIAITSKNTSAFKSLIALIEKSNVKKVIFISSTSVYDNSNKTITEGTETNDGLLAQIERLFINTTTFKTTILRFGGLFGYNRQPGNFFKHGKPISNPKGYINYIHRDDCISIIKNCLEQNVFGHVFNACADSHPTRRDFYTNEFKKSGRTEPIFDEISSNKFKIINSDKLKTELNYTFNHLV